MKKVSERKPKFTVGQVVGISGYMGREYRPVIMRSLTASPEFQYNLGTFAPKWWNESQLHPLTSKERGDD